MIFSNSSAEVFVPDGSPENQAVSRTTHLAIAAHPDDIEILAYDGIMTSYNASHSIDQASALILAMDLSPFLKDAQLDPVDYASSLVEHFKDEVIDRILRMS